MSQSSPSSRSKKPKPHAEAADDDLDPRLIARIEKAVLKKVMHELRPLLVELATLAETARKQQPSEPTPVGTAEALQKQAFHQLEKMQTLLSERIRMSEERFRTMINKRLPD